MVRSIEQLKSILNVEIPYMSFDLETSGLDPEDDIITGASFSLEPRIGYYVPIETVVQYKHKTLGYEALDVLYAAMLRAMIVLLFNAEFDIRKMRFSKRKYDMSKIKFIDVQLPAWYMDTDNKNTSLKWFEKYFLGYYRKDLNETMQTYGLDTFDTSKIDPDHILFYGAQDGISTYELFFIVEEYLKEFGLSGQIDLQLIYPFMIMKEHPTDINIKLLEEELNYVILRLEELDKLMDESIGDVNLNSSTQKEALFKSFGLDTGVRTPGGSMSTSKDAIDGLIEKMENSNRPIPEWLQYMGERSKLEKLRSTYYGSLKEQVNFYNGKVRINYRNTNASTGRLSSGKFIYE
jgi:DNA polymerase I-like protein with 3'-5' exonuclease and polymerase domains